ncbi:MAG: flagellar basal-body MS-ring/collar protein FliF [Desulfitobacteriaceae bacterium]
MNFWADLQKSWREFWSKLTRSQQIITVVAPLLLAAALITLLIWAGRPQYVPIFTKIDLASAAQVRNKLVDLKIPYQPADGGTTLLVPEKQLAEARLQLASAGLPQGSKFSFDSINQIHLGETDADRKLRYKLGLQSELSDTLKTLSGVQDASVQVVTPEPSLFVNVNNEKPATAAVTLKLVPGTKMTDEQIRGVANLLAASVEGLQPENVTIIDTNGNVLSDVLSKSKDLGNLSGSQLQIQQTVEDKIQKSVQTMLDRALGAGNAVVRANVTLDFDQIKIVSETHGPGALVSKQGTNESSSNGTPSGSVPGTASNVPGYQTPQTTGSVSTSIKTSTTENYDPDKIQKEQVVSPGAVKRLSISVMADSGKVDQAHLDQIKGIVASAAGIDTARGDQIQVAAIPFNTTAAQQEKDAIARVEKNQRYMQYIEIGAAALVGLIFLLFMLRSQSKRKRGVRQLTLGHGDQPISVIKAEEILLAQQRAEEEAQAKLAQKKTRTVAELEKQKIKEAVELYTRNNTDEVARLIKTWLSEER